MIAVFKHELRLYFHSLTAYVFGAFLLLAVGVGTMLYNISAAYSNFEYVLSFSNMIFVVIVPVLTMRVIAEERRQKTDQLLYSLPISTAGVILGKYLALLVLFLIPMGIISLYPLILAQYGDVYLPTAYGSLLAYFLLGAALLAIGVFLSSLTESQGIAAGISVAVMLLSFYSVNLAEYATATVLGSAIALLAVVLILGWVVYRLTRSRDLGVGVALVGAAALGAVLWLDQSLLEGLIPRFMESISLFDRFETFVDGVFDMTAVVYFLSVTVFFLFLSVQSLEKRRYN